MYRTTEDDRPCARGPAPLLDRALARYPVTTTMLVGLAGALALLALAAASIAVVTSATWMIGLAACGITGHTITDPAQLALIGCTLVFDVLLVGTLAYSAGQHLLEGRSPR